MKADSGVVMLRSMALKHLGAATWRVGHCAPQAFGLVIAFFHWRRIQSHQIE
jgi:hypothetical protein